MLLSKNEQFCPLTAGLYVCANEQLRVCFDVLIRYSLSFSSEIILKQLFPSGSVNIVELSPRLLFKQLLACLSTIRFHRESIEQTGRKIGLFTKPGKIKNTQTWSRNAQEKALQLYWLFLRAFFPFNLFMFYLFIVMADSKRKTNELNDKW